MNDLSKSLLEQAGFRLFKNGTQVVAADGGSSGAATICSQLLIELVLEECIEQVYPQWIKDNNHVDPTILADAVFRVKQRFGIK